MNLDHMRLKRLETLILWGTALFPALFVTLLIVIQWPEYWQWINFEMTPMTSLEVSVMYTTALVAFTAGARSWLRHEAEYRDWWLLGGGFFYFALDDRFAIHERIRDKILIPHDISLPFLPWVGPGDFILLVYAAIGIALLPRFARLFRAHRRALRLLFAAVGVAFVAVMLDSVNIDRLSEDAQRLEQTIEECLELTAQVLFLQAFIIGWFARFGRKD
ncbi:MAG TPA: hypothetical protein VFR06_01765 [Gallionellaceae bacterium]|nr:hypothetical protein [Gallionellaceae bacterium]